jgi:hypothetical protein
LQGDVPEWELGAEEFEEVVEDGERAGGAGYSGSEDGLEDGGGGGEGEEVVGEWEIGEGVVGELSVC